MIFWLLVFFYQFDSMRNFTRCIVLIFFSQFLIAQDQISDVTIFDSFFKNAGTNLLLLGENHSSAVGSNLYPQLIETFNKNHGLTTFMIEFGPSEAYFYNEYLATGDPKLLDFTISAGYYTGWKKAWKKIYDFNKTLKKPIHIEGVDFDRTRTFAYCLYKILQKKKHHIPVIDSLLSFIKDKSFYTTYTIGYPTQKDKEFVKQTKSLLKKHWEVIKTGLSPADVNYLTKMLQNNVEGYGGTREMGINKNIVSIIKNSADPNFFLLIGRDHTYSKAIYDDQPRLATYLKQETAFTTLSGLILHENSQQWGKDYKETITLYELKNKIPWKEFYPLLLARLKSNLTLIRLNGELSALSMYTDYLLIAKNQAAIVI